ncbi:MAG TPA: GyrI-like domain-containing protein [Candidatus Nanopelagicales bacterium]|nr:GyrI-like domain-containing protein [Candidatus Nanopelagicales bacterium]
MADDAAPSVEIVELEAVRVAAIRSVVGAEDIPDFMSDALSLVAAALREAGVAPAGPPFARYFAGGPDGLDMAAGFPVAEPFLAAGVVHPGELPAGPAAVATHVGQYQGLEAAWNALRERVGALGRPLGDNPWEVYVVAPGSDVDEAEWRTELVWPLRGDAGGAGETGSVPRPDA